MLLFSDDLKLPSGSYLMCNVEWRIHTLLYLGKDAGSSFLNSKSLVFSEVFKGRTVYKVFVS